MTQNTSSPSTSVFLSVGFRPLFALGVLFAALAMGLWAAYWSGIVDVSQITPIGGFLFWHGHEFIMGFALAIVFGFLLTAVQNWTGLKTTTPITLLLVALAWLYARMVMLFGSHLPPTIILTACVLPSLMVVFMIAKPIIKKRLWRNLFAPVALLMMAIIDGKLMLSALNHEPLPSGLFLVATLFISLLITMIGGRVIPMFTANNLGIKKAIEPKWGFALSVIPLPLLMLSQLFSVGENQGMVTSLLCVLLVIGHTNRLKLWFHKELFQRPMLWSLWIFYACLPVGWFILAIKPWMPLSIINASSIGLHVITIGAIAGLISAMVSRVSLGHTGRVIHHDKWIVAAFIALLTSLLIRTLGVALMGFSPTLISISALLFSISFIILFFRFVKIWVSPRAK